ncbi:phosphorelay protein [Sulfitobacter sp. F26169L]|uniref:phosphorelay protein n=1 Tax=Sulfitobacter sp. F26169L TaxID=2996015 RepID=UPI002260C771|nr:phosphorelay protein [Sulfitobacter sp. F26169L]MCX7567268.1 phosphorelay protein [Sulfitobacter sp. F26169L]
MSAPARKQLLADQQRVRFVDTLAYQKADVARHALAAWDGESAEYINARLEDARSILNGICGSAAALGFYDVDATAQHSVAQIDAHLHGAYADLAICPGEIIWCVDTFVEACDAAQIHL